MGSPPRHQRLPYLQRNWLTVLNYWQNGGSGLGFKVDDVRSGLTNGDDEHYQRPAKRRRFAERSPGSGIGHEIDGFVLHEDPIEPRRSMRIESLIITHKEEPRIRSNGSNVCLGRNIPRSSKDITTTKARCKITITTPGRTVGDTHVLFCDSQICTISTLQNAHGMSRMARVYLLQPFVIPEEKIFIERDDDAVFDLADCYALRIELESAGDLNWPPLSLVDLVPKDDISIISPAPDSYRHWTLRCEFQNILDPGRRSGSLRVRRGSGPSSRTDFSTRIDLTWATALPEKGPSKKGSLARLVNFEQQQEEAMPLTNGHINGQLENGHMPNGHVHVIEDEVDEDDHAEGELTPSRSLRMRGPTKSYNLKFLSAQAQGREPRKRSKTAEAKKPNTDRVTYHLPKEAAPIREVVVDGFSCCICHAPHQSFLQLRAHLVSHSQYSFEINSDAGKSGCLIDISCVVEEFGPLLHPKIYQLGKPTKAFDIEKYVEGDNSWVTSRLGPNNDDLTVAGSRKAPQPKVVATPRVAQRTVVRRKEKKIYVPETKQPLFDPLSKARLTPGTEIRRPVADDGWLIQKHRDIVQDFCDLPQAEKDYIKEWDAFIQKRRISSEAFIGRALVEFVNEKLSWIIASKSRSLEFGKHLTVLIARGLDEETVRIVQSRLQDARAHQKPTDNASDTTLTSDAGKISPQRNSRGCALCGRAVRGPSLLICSNESCNKPLYHDNCIRDTALMPVEHPQWQCNDCKH